MRLAGVVGPSLGFTCRVCSVKTFIGGGVSASETPSMPSANEGNVAFGDIIERGGFTEPEAVEFGVPTPEIGGTAGGIELQMTAIEVASVAEAFSWACLRLGRKTSSNAENGRERPPAQKPVQLEKNGAKSGLQVHGFMAPPFIAGSKVLLAAFGMIVVVMKVPV